MRPGSFGAIRPCHGNRRKKGSMMTNSTCQLDWATEHQDDHLNINECLQEIDICTSRLKKADGLPDVGGFHAKAE